MLCHHYRLGNYQKIFILCLSEEQRQNIVVLLKKQLLLAKGLEMSISPKVRRTKLLQKIAEESGLSGGTVSKLNPVELIREDRER